MTLEATILLILLAAVLAGLLGFVIAKKGGGESTEDLGKINKELEALGTRLTELSDVGRKSQGELAKTVGDQLHKVSQSMGKSLEESSTKTAKSFGEIEERLKAFSQISTALSGEVGDLKGILDNKQARGAFGEIQLESLVSDHLSPEAYSFQSTLSNGMRADCLIHFPKPYGPIVVDAKFPLESYRALMEADSDEARTRIGKEFKRDFKKHISDIAGKYILPGETADRALLFLPSEAIYVELHSNFGDVVAHGQKLRVAIVSPSTMWALLNAIMSVLRDIKMQEQAGLIQKAVAGLKRDVEILADRAAKLSKHFRMTQQDVDDIQISTNRIVTKSDKITSVELAEDGEEPGEAIEGPRIRSVE